MAKQSNQFRLFRNQLLSDTRAVSDSTTCIRICWLDVEDDLVGVINLKEPKSNPYIKRYSALCIALSDKQLFLSSFADLSTEIEVSSEYRNSHLEKRDQLADVLIPFFEARRYELFHEGMRLRTIKKYLSELNLSRPTVMEYLRRFYHFGMTRDAFLPRYFNSGGIGVEKQSKNGKKLGPEVSISSEERHCGGMYLSEEAKKKLKDGYIKYYAKSAQSLEAAYEDTKHEYFYHSQIKLPNGTTINSVDPKKPVPSKRQFEYWGTKVVPTREVYLRRKSDTDIELNHKPNLHKARNLEGPGAQFELDGTFGLVELVDHLDLLSVIGKAHVYVLICRYSQLITGWAIELEKPSYEQLMVALLSAFTDKQEQLSEEVHSTLNGMGLTCNDVWPSAIICDALLSDSGPELTGIQSDRLSSLGLFRWETAKPRAATWKPFVESYFKNLKDKLANIPGASSRFPVRQHENPKHKAILTLPVFRDLLALAFAEWNRTKIVHDHPDALALVKSGFTTTPINFWNWGVEHRSGSGRIYSRDYIFQRLLPTADCGVSDEGIVLHGLRYWSENLKDKLEFHRLPGKPKSLQISYDPRDVSQVWVTDRFGNFIDTCELTPAYQRYWGGDLRYVRQLMEAEDEAEAVSKARTSDERHIFKGVQRKLVEDAIASDGGKRKVGRVENDARSRVQAEERQKHKFQKSSQLGAIGSDVNSVQENSSASSSDAYYFGDD